MWILRALCIVAACAVALCIPTTPAQADTVFASEVVSYSHGPNTPIAHWMTGQPYTVSFAAIGAPAGITGLQSGWPSVVSPFSSPYDTDQIVSIGEGGHLTLKLPQYAYIKPGMREIGVFTNACLMDANYPSGACTNPAQVLAEKSGKVEVSEDGTQWFSLGVLDFNVPTNYYLNAGPYDTAAPANPQAADFGKPFEGDLSSFNGKTYSQILSLLNGSAGGAWLDLSPSGLSRIRYLRFSVLDDGDDLNDVRLEIDGVAIASGALSAPEPATSALLALGGGLAWLLNRRRRTA